MRKSRLAKKPTGDVKTKYFPLKGGLNLVDAPITMPSGMVLAAVNYELLTRDGYRRVDGYERFDGRDSPSAASYWILDFDTGTDPLTPFAVPPDGSKVTGATSGATGEVLSLVETSGDWQTGSVIGYLVLGGVVGTFQDGENLSFIGASDGFDSGFSAGFG